MKRKHSGCLIAAVLAFGLLGLAGYGFVQFQHHVEMGFASPRLYVSCSATGDGQVDFVEWGFLDRGVSVFVRPLSSQHAVPQLLADLSGYADCFRSAVWSRDGSAIACRSRVLTDEDAAEDAARKRSKDASFRPKPDYVPYCYAYDFREGKSLAKTPARGGSRHDWEVHSKAIEELLESRGGPGEAITADQVKARQQKLNWRQWQPYKQAMRNAP